jgi:hypothetical protein
MTRARRDDQPAGPGFGGQMRQERAVAHQDGRLQVVEPGHDRLHRLADREQLPEAARRRERPRDRRRQVRRAGGGDHRGHPLHRGQRRVAGPISLLKPHDRGVADRPRLPAVDEHAPLATRPPGRHDTVLAEEVAGSGALVKVRFAQSPADPPVGHDVVEVTHQVGLGHHRQRLHVSLGHLTRVESSQPLAVPRRSLDGDRQQLPQGTQPLGAYLVPRPADARGVFGQQPLEAGDVTLAQRLTGTIHRRAHAPILRDRGHLHIPSGRPSPGARAPL